MVRAIGMRSRPFAIGILAFATSVVVLLAGEAVAIDYDLVAIGNANNSADRTGFGAVGYDFQMGRYEVTIGQYTAFLNAVAKTDAYGLYNPGLASNLDVAGIGRSGSTGSYAYSVLSNSGGSGNRPVTHVSWFDAARFANWMTNGQPGGAQGPGTTETGAYTLEGRTSGVAPARNPGSLFYIPSESEWYKAAY